MKINKVKRIFPYIILLGLSLPIMLINLGEYPIPWYDEGLNTHTANVIQKFNVYGTYTMARFNPHDPAVTTGPTVLIPVAVLYRIFGNGMFQARIVSVFYGIVALLSLRYLAEKLYGYRASFPITLFFLLVPTVGGVGFFLLSRQVLGEIAALAFILLGLICWMKTWEKSGMQWGFIAGTLLGLGMISKLQPSIAVVPMLLITTLVLVKGRRLSENRGLIIGPFIAVLIVAAWLLIQYQGQSPDLHLQNSNDSLYAIRILILTGYWRRTLSTGSIGILIGIGIAVVGSIYNLQRKGDIHKWRGRDFLEFSLMLLALLAGLWFAVFSIGWPRYIYIGWSIAILLLGGLAWKMYQSVITRPAIQRRFKRSWADTFLWSSLVIVLICIQGYPLAFKEHDRSAQEMAEYIRENLEPSDVIESWEWQIDALSNHALVNHPPQRLLLHATEQRFIDRVPFDLSYDLSQVNPDYLLTGPFSDWTGVYRPAKSANNFEQVVAFGPYSLWSKQ